MEDRVSYKREDFFVGEVVKISRIQLTNGYMATDSQYVRTGIIAELGERFARVKILSVQGVPVYTESFSYSELEKVTFPNNPS